MGGVVGLCVGGLVDSVSSLFRYMHWSNWGHTIAGRPRFETSHEHWIQTLTWKFTAQRSTHSADGTNTLTQK